MRRVLFWQAPTNTQLQGCGKLSGDIWGVTGDWLESIKGSLAPARWILRTVAAVVGLGWAASRKVGGKGISSWTPVEGGGGGGG